MEFQHAMVCHVLVPFSKQPSSNKITNQCVELNHICYIFNESVNDHQNAVKQTSRTLDPQLFLDTPLVSFNFQPLQPTILPNMAGGLANPCFRNSAYLSSSPFPKQWCAFSKACHQLQNCCQNSRPPGFLPLFPKSLAAPFFAD